VQWIIFSISAGKNKEKIEKTDHLLDSFGAIKIWLEMTIILPFKVSQREVLMSELQKNKK
jgi:hypothetical protein